MEKKIDEFRTEALVRHTVVKEANENGQPGVEGDNFKVMKIKRRERPK